MEELVIDYSTGLIKIHCTKFTKGILLLLGCAVLKAYHARVNDMVKFGMAINGY